MSPANPPRFKKLRSLYNWHRYVGLSVALLVLILAVTGIMLNHTNALRLDQRFVQSEWLLDWYGIKAPRAGAAFHAGDHWISQWDQSVYLNDKSIAGNAAALKGALRTEQYLLIATAETLWLFTPNGQLIEHISAAHGLPVPIERLGRDPEGATVIATAQGTFRADVDQLQWTPNTGQRIDWIEPEALPETLRTDIRGNYRSNDLNWERVVLDLHSGRIAGNAGVIIMDLAAVLLIFLALTGFMLWWIRGRKRRQHQRASNRG